MEMNPQGKLERALLIQTRCHTQDDYETDLAEFKALTKTAGAIPLISIISSRIIPDPKYYIGSGKAAEIQSIIKAESLNLVLFNRVLSPRQKRNLEELFKCRVVDRTELVLDIFSQRARSFEGKLQVSLAQLQYLSTRLVRGWTHLERQRGGIGLRGPGETQLETDRRLIRNRIKTLKTKLDKVKKQRHQNRQTRYRARIPLVALVGYTNAGKSSLFSELTSSPTWIADQLFATLDPLLRQVRLPNNQKLILADTVGFIRQLPHELIDAFSATLEEVRKADLLLHVVDASHPNRLAYIEAVNRVLKEIKAHQIPQLLVYNKADCVNPHTLPMHLESASSSGIWISAKTKQGLDELRVALVERLSF
jgi:GTP-binding protein HflX